MKKILFLLFATLFASQSLFAQVNIVVAPDSVYAELPATEQEINLPSHITNNSGDTVTIRWTRVVEQEPQGWSHAFCDKNVCWFGGVSTKTFVLIDGEEGSLKPIFYPNEIPGIGVMRLYYVSETAGVIWADTAVYVAVATGAVGTVEAELVRDVAIFPSPANDVLNIITVDVNLQGKWQITDTVGKVWVRSKSAQTAVAGQISVAQLPAGIYFLNVMTPKGNQIVAKRFIVQR